MDVPMHLYLEEQHSFKNPWLWGLSLGDPGFSLIICPNSPSRVWIEGQSRSPLASEFTPQGSLSSKNPGTVTTITVGVPRCSHPPPGHPSIPTPSVPAQAEGLVCLSPPLRFCAGTVATAKAGSAVQHAVGQIGPVTRQLLVTLPREVALHSQACPVRWVKGGRNSTKD